MDYSIFRPHGTFSVNTEGRVLVMRAQGPWNAEMSELYGQSVKQQVQELSGAPWVLLGVISEEGVHTPDSFIVSVDIIRAHKKLGRVGTAIIFRYQDSPLIARRVFEKLYNEADEPHAFFADEPAARQWLSERLTAAGAAI